MAAVADVAHRQGLEGAAARGALEHPAPSDVHPRAHAVLAAAAGRLARTRATCCKLIEQLGSDDLLMFSTDYPHWHVRHARARPIPAGLSTRALRRKILSENARAFYRLD